MERSIPTFQLTSTARFCITCANTRCHCLCGELAGGGGGRRIWHPTKPDNAQINSLRCSQNYSQVPPRAGKDFSSRGFCMLRRWGFNVIHPKSHSFLTEPVACAGRAATVTPRAFPRGVCLMWYRRHLSSGAAIPGFPLHPLPPLPN